MVEFNPDGSIKLPGKIAAQKRFDNGRMHNGHCMKIEKELVRTFAPKACALHIELSPRVQDTRFVSTIFSEVNRTADTPMKLVSLDGRRYRVEIGTAFKRCSECSALVNKYRSFIEIIEKKGLCTFSSQRNFAYEDYFD